MFLAVSLAVPTGACSSSDSTGASGGEVVDGGESVVVDAAAADANDGGTDAQIDGDASFVPGTVVFSDDFSDGNLADDWDVLTVANGTTAEIDMGAFHVKTKVIAAQEADFAHLRKTVPGAPSRVRLSFSATFPSTTFTKGSMAIATVDVSNNHFFTLWLRDTDSSAPAASLEEISLSGTKRNVLGSPPPTNVATKIVVDIDLAAGTASVTWDATKALDAAAIQKGTTEDPTIRVGAVYDYGPQDAFEAHFDDVVLEYY